MKLRSMTSVGRLTRLCVASLWAVWSVQSLAAPSVPEGASAAIVSLQGEGDQRAAADTVWRSAKLAQALGAGDFVRTHEAARMGLLFADQTQLRLHQNTVLQVKAVATPTQPVTTLQLQSGRAWAQTRRAPGTSLQFETPAATAAIRGTDWDLSVADDGRTMITVLSGVVEFGNDKGQVRVAANEAAYADPGQAPVKMVLTHPRDRIQWVNALQADPAPHVAVQAFPPEYAQVYSALLRRDGRAARDALHAVQTPQPQWSAAWQAAVALQEGDLQTAHHQLTQQVAAHTTVLASWLMLAELQRMEGNGPEAVQTLQSALQRWPAHPVVQAQLARAQLWADQLEDARRTLDAALPAEHVEMTLVRAELARHQGEGAQTLAHYRSALQQAPKEARALLGLGSALAEREDTVPARWHLQQALAQAPDLPTVGGEIGTLETLAHHWEAAQAAFDEALKRNPSDYVAWTGLGLLRLKQGTPDTALDAFLRAGVLEPRYARAKAYTAVAYYQLGRHQDALATLKQAAALDDRDPVPYLWMSQIYTDRFEPGQALEASRAAMQRMPYLKSLNQLANDQQGRANLGAALAFFGLEDWAQEWAQQSFYPYWGGGHLFRADRYPGEFNKNSALMQGFLTDPMAFGASQRHASLVQQPGSHGALRVTHASESYRADSQEVKLNGMAHSPVPVSWFVHAQNADMRGYPFDWTSNVMPATRAGDALVHQTALTLGLGLQPTERVNVFAYANQLDGTLRSQNAYATAADGRLTQGALGMAYRWSPTSQTWIKWGQSDERSLATGYPSLYALSQQPVVLAESGVITMPRKKFSELQLRHTEDTPQGGRWSVSLEHVKERQDNSLAAVGHAVRFYDDGSYTADIFMQVGWNKIDRRYTGLTAGLMQPLSDSLTWEGELGWGQIRQRVDGYSGVALLIRGTMSEQTVHEADTQRMWTPRTGVVWKPWAGSTVRVAYQDWLRPLSTSTLTNVETVGIPVEDRLVQAGGRHKRVAAQWAQEWGERTFLSARASHLQVRNPGLLGFDLQTPSMPFLADFRNAQLLNLSTTDVLEGSSGFGQGTLSSWSMGVNQVFDRRWSGYAKYLYQRSEIDTVGLVSGVRGRMPYIPRHTLAVGGTWASAQRVYLSARAVYRTDRFEDAQNLTRRAPGWTVDLMGFWESMDKHWIIGAAIQNWSVRSSERQTTRYVLDARYRF